MLPRRFLSFPTCHCRIPAKIQFPQITVLYSAPLLNPPLPSLEAIGNLLTACEVGGSAKKTADRFAGCGKLRSLSSTYVQLILFDIRSMVFFQTELLFDVHRIVANQVILQLAVLSIQPTLDAVSYLSGCSFYGCKIQSFSDFVIENIHSFYFFP